MTAVKQRIQPATRADLETLPLTWRGEIIEGTLYAFPRPCASHASIQTRVAGDIEIPFDRRRGGPGGWSILLEPGIKLPRAPELSPDLGGWRKERMPSLPRTGPITVVPDWICEILSPRTCSYDLVIKRRFYAEIGVSYLWYIDPQARALTVSKLEGGRWLELGTHGADENVRADPFAAVELSLAEWFDGLPFEDDNP